MELKDAFIFCLKKNEVQTFHTFNPPVRVNFNFSWLLWELCQMRFVPTWAKNSGCCFKIAPNTCLLPLFTGRLLLLYPPRAISILCLCTPVHRNKHPLLIHGSDRFIDIKLRVCWRLSVASTQLCTLRSQTLLNPQIFFLFHSKTIGATKHVMCCPFN